jgi:hypothetical protein
MMPRLIALAVGGLLVVAPGASAKPRGAPAAVLHRAEAAFKTGHNGTRRDISPLLQKLAVDLPRLHGTERRRATSLLARPTDGLADPNRNGYSVPEATPLCSAHYCVHYVTTGPDAPPLADADGNGVPDWVQTVSGVAENVHSVENGQLGWREPKSDGTLGGGNGLTDIYLLNLGGTGVYGYTAPDVNQRISTIDHSVHSYLVLDNDYAPSEFVGYSSPVDPLDVTMAHEYNHVLHYTYDALEETWMFEATAVWMEGKVYEPVHDYLQYLRGWIQLTPLPLTTFNGRNPNDRTNVKVYGSSVWSKWLDARFGPAVIRSAWEDSINTRPRSFAPLAYDTAIRQHRGRGFSDQFGRFAAATAEWQARNSGFPEGSLYPDVTRLGTVSVNGSAGVATLDHTAFALLDVPLTRPRRIKLAVLAPRGTASALALVGRTGGSPGGTATQALRQLPKGGIGTAVLPAGQFERITAAIINSDFQQRGVPQTADDWRFKKDRQPFYVDVSTDFTAPRLRSVKAKGKKVTVTFSERIRGVTRSSLRLLSGGHVVHSKLTFHDRTRTATLAPSGGFKPGRRYTLQLTNAITDLALNRLRSVRRSI